MPWTIIKRRLGIAGGRKQRHARQKQWDTRYGESQWAIGYLIDGDFMLQEDAIQHVYNASYAAHFENHPSDLDELIKLARMLRNPHARATTGVDLQVPAIMDYLKKQGLILRGKEVVDIGSWKGQASHPISTRLNPNQIKCVLNPSLTLEAFWQKKKCLAVWKDEEESS